MKVRHCLELLAGSALFKRDNVLTEILLILLSLKSLENVTQLSPRSLELHLHACSAHLSVADTCTPRHMTPSLWVTGVLRQEGGEGRRGEGGEAVREREREAG